MLQGGLRPVTSVMPADRCRPRQKAPGGPLGNWALRWAVEASSHTCLGKEGNCGLERPNQSWVWATERGLAQGRAGGETAPPHLGPLPAEPHSLARGPWSLPLPQSRDPSRAHHLCLCPLVCPPPSPRGLATPLRGFSLLLGNPRPGLVGRVLLRGCDRPLPCSAHWQDKFPEARRGGRMCPRPPQANLGDPKSGAGVFPAVLAAAGHLPPRSNFPVWALPPPGSPP